MPLFFSPRVHFCRSICPGCCIPRLAEPNSPRTCHHVRALLGHITEYLLQLLGEAEQHIWGGAAEGAKMEEVQWLQGGPAVTLQHRKREVCVYMTECVFGALCGTRAGGPGSDVTW